MPDEYKISIQNAIEDLANAKIKLKRLPAEKQQDFSKLMSEIDDFINDCNLELLNLMQHFKLDEKKRSEYDRLKESISKVLKG
jgi:hypothetical protein